MYFKLACGNVRRSLRSYSVYFFTLALGICVFYAFNSIDAQGALLNAKTSLVHTLELIRYLIGYVSVVVAVVLGFLIVYANSYLVKRRKKEFGIYLTLGMDGRKVSRVLVYETFVVGLVSLVCGILAGTVLSQLMLYLTASLFDVRFEQFQVVFSPQACLQTVAYFAIMFLVALGLSVVSVRRTRLVRLVNADRLNQPVSLRRLSTSIVLFVIAIAAILEAYYLLRVNGLVPSAGFYASAIVVFLGTFLLFYALSGVAQALVQSNKRVYLRGLRMFVFRQINAKVNSAWASIALVSIVLFFAITATCGGFAICTTMNANLERATAYDASVFSSVSDYPGAGDPGDPSWEDVLGRAKQADFDMLADLQRNMPGYDGIVAAAAQIRHHESEQQLYYGQALDSLSLHEVPLPQIVTQGFEAMEGSRMDIVTLSDYNATRQLQGLAPASLAEDECLVWCDVDTIVPCWKDLAARGGSFSYDGKTFHMSADGVSDTALETSIQLSHIGSLVVNDDQLPSDSHVVGCTVNVMYAGEREQAEDAFLHGLSQAEQQGAWSLGDGYGRCTALDAYDESMGTSATVTYLAIYIGLVFLIACAAILALQQLSEASDGARRYRVLSQLGAERRMVDRALLAQVGVYFAAPLVVAICHSIVAMGEVRKMVDMITSMQILQPLLLTAAFAAAIYGGYFLITYVTARGIVTTRAARRE